MADGTNPISWGVGVEPARPWKNAFIWYESLALSRASWYGFEYSRGIGWGLALTDT